MGSVVVMPIMTIREGTTDGLVMQLLADDKAIDLTGVHHVELEIRDMKRHVYRYSSLDASPKVGVLDTANGKVWLDPPASLFKQLYAPYLLYWLVWETETEWFSVPEETEAMIKVRKNW